MSKSGAGPHEGPFNFVAVRGVVTAEARVSVLPGGGVVHNFDVRADVGGDRHVVPVAWHDPVRPPRLRRGDEVVVVGVIRRRWFRAAGGSQSRTELLAESVARCGSNRAAGLLARVASAVAPPDPAKRRGDAPPCRRGG